VQVLAAGGSPRFFAVEQLPVGVDLSALKAWQHELMRAARHDEHPWNAGLLIESLVSQAAGLWLRQPQTGARRLALAQAAAPR